MVLEKLLASAYPLARAALFRLEPEVAHALTLKTLQAQACSGVSRVAYPSVPDNPRTVMGIRFANPVGLAAGADKNGECIEGFGALGFGFIELGGVTPRPQPGNPQPRMFRLPAAHAIINRLGFNNQGVDQLAERLKKHTYKGVIGVNLGKNLDTPLEKATDDYLICYEKIYAHAQFATINISSPNTKNLRQLQGESELSPLLKAMKAKQAALAQQHGKLVPLSVKIAPDLEEDQIEGIAKLLVKHQLDAVTATNTTISRTAVAGMPHADETGGLSGAPVLETSNRVIRRLAHHLDGELPIIGVGGILSGADAKAKMDAGAALVQFYTGMIYRGPALVSEVATALR